MGSTPQGTSLTRSLGLGHVFVISTGAMVSSGLFLLPSLAADKAGPAAVISYLLAGVLAIPAMLSVAELSTAMPAPAARTTSSPEPWAQQVGLSQA